MKKVYSILFILMTLESLVMAKSSEAFNESSIISNHQNYRNLAVISTNAFDFVEGKTNLMVDFLSSNTHIHPHVRIYSSMEQETVKRFGLSAPVSVSRTAHGMGLSWYMFDTQSQTNFIISPAFVFGKIDDPYDTSTLAGLGLKVSGLLRLGDHVTIELGTMADTIHNDHRNRIHFGLGYFL